VVEKRSIYLINPKFQLKFSAFVCSFVLLTSIIYPITIYELIGSITTTLNNPEVTKSLFEKRTSLILTLILLQTGFICLIFVICIFQGHKIAGPMYKLKKYLDNIKDGNPPEKLYFRKGDHFLEIAESFNQAMDKIQEVHLKDFIYLSEINSYINNLAMILPEDKKNVLNEISSKLSEIQDRVKN
jgi:hypothetical protein